MHLTDEIIHWPKFTPCQLKLQLPRYVDTGLVIVARTNEDDRLIQIVNAYYLVDVVVMLLIIQLGKGRTVVKTILDIARPGTAALKCRFFAALLGRSHLTFLMCGC